MKALLVDLYETMVRTDWRALQRWMTSRLRIDGPALMAAFEATSEPRGRGRYGSVKGDLAALLTAARGASDDSLVGALEAELLQFLEQSTHLYDDVLPVLRALRGAGTRVAIVSNCDHATGPLLDRLGLDREVDATVLSFRVGSLKPDAAIFQHALAQLGVDAADAVFVDDQDRFLDGAQALGIRTLRIARPTPYAMTGPAGAHPVITDLRSLTAI